MLKCFFCLKRPVDHVKILTKGLQEPTNKLNGTTEELDNKVKFNFDSNRNIPIGA